VQDLEMLLAGTAEFAIVPSDVLTQALFANGVFEGREGLESVRAVLALFPEPIAVLVRAEAGAGGLAALVDGRIDVGLPGSPAAAMAEAVLAAAGLKAAAEDSAGLAAEALAPALCGGELDAVVVAAGQPSGTLMGLARACPLALLPIAGQAREAALAGRPYLVPAIIPGGIYPGVAEDVATLGPTVVLATSESVPAEAVRALVEALLADPARLAAMHPALAGWTPRWAADAVQFAPLHEGAVEALDAAGLL
jgi:TRAP transporter TAXI family solute receptor